MKNKNVSRIYIFITSFVTDLFKNEYFILNVY